MPRIQVYLPDELYAELKARRLPASELLQNAVRAEVRRQKLGAEADRYIARLEREVGKPSDEEMERATAIAKRIAQRPARRTA